MHICIMKCIVELFGDDRNGRMDLQLPHDAEKWYNYAHEDKQKEFHRNHLRVRGDGWLHGATMRYSQGGETVLA